MARCPPGRPTGKWIYYIENVQDRGYFPGGGNAPSYYAMDYPVLTRIHPDGTGAEKLLSGRYRKGAVHLVLLDPPARRLTGRPDGRAHVGRPGSDEERRRPPDLRREDRTRRSASTCPRTRRSATRIPPGARTASSSSTCKNGRDGARGAPVIYRYDPVDEEDIGAQPARLHAALVVAGRAVRRGHARRAPSGPTSRSSTPGTGRRSSGSRTTAARGRRSGRRRATRSPTCTSRG